MYDLPPDAMLAIVGNVPEGIDMFIGGGLLALIIIILILILIF